MNLPEDLLRERLRNLYAKAIPEFDDLDLLSIVGTSQIGRLRYSQRDHLEEDVPAQDLDELLSYRGTADLFAHLLERYATYSGVSGVQPKVLVRDAKAPDRMFHRGATHIVKAFDARKYPELAANELICTRGAQAAGIPTARLQLSRNRQLLIAERFDRTAEGNYLGIEDFCVLDGRRAHGRYDGSYEGVAGRIADFGSSSALAHAREQYALMVGYFCCSDTQWNEKLSDSRAVDQLHSARDSAQRKDGSRASRADRSWSERRHCPSVTVWQAASWRRSRRNGWLESFTRGLARLGCKPKRVRLAD